MPTEYPHLFSPFTIRGVTYRNRIFATPTGMHWAEEGTGMPTEATARFYAKKARGGAASVTHGETLVNRTDAARRPNHDHIVPDFANLVFPKRAWVKVADGIRRHGAVPSLQLSHGGLFSEPVLAGGHQPIGPDTFTKENGTEVRGMSRDDMERVAGEFAEAAWLAKDAGFAQVMVHGGHGWLLGQFLSPTWNHRTDEYGGSIDNRARFPLMVLDAIRSRVGDDFVIELRISGEEHVPQASTLAETIEFAKMAEDKIDILHVSGGDYHHSDHYVFPTVYQEHGLHAPISAALKAAGVKVPIATVGGISDPAHMERLVADGITDFVAVGRAILADPDLPVKTHRGMVEEIRPCVRCNSCMGGMYEGQYGCDVNPLAGNEPYILPVSNRVEPRRVLVVGGGPGGMMAAVTAAKRGHDVTLVEKASKLGGTLRFTDVDPHKEDLRNYKDYLVRQVGKHVTDVRLGVTADTALLDELQPEAVIVATGAKPRPLAVPGADQAHVMHATRVYDDPDAVKQTVVMIGGGLIGAEVALHLSDMGKDVTLIEVRDDVATDANLVHRFGLKEQLANREDRLHLRVGSTVTEISEDGVHFVNRDGVREFAPAGTVVFAVGMEAERETVSELRSWTAAESFHTVGDCTGPARVRKAIHGGFHAARDIGRPLDEEA